MRIAMIGQKGIPARYGGVERHVEALAGEFARAGHTVTVYARAWYSKDESAPEHPRIKRVVQKTIHTHTLDTVTHVARAVWHALFQSYDVIHFHGVGPAIFAWIPRLLKPHTKIIVTVHSLNREHPEWNRIGRMAFQIGEWAAVHFPHRTIVVTEYLRTYFRRRYGCDTVVIPNGIAAPRRMPDEALLRAWKLKPKQYVIFVGRLVATKGIETLLLAWRALRKKYPDVMRGRMLAIVGEGSFSDEYVAELHRYAGHDLSIIFTGWQEGAPLLSLMSYASVLVQPSFSEGLPMTVLEAMAYGVPTIVSDIPAHREIVHEAALRFASGDAEELARRLREAFTDILWYEKYGGEQKRVVLAAYRWEKVAERTLAAYHA